MNTKQAVQEGRTVLGIEFGSTRIKAVLVDENAHPIAQGGYDWETAMWTTSGVIRWRISGKASRAVIRKWRRM